MGRRAEIAAEIAASNGRRGAAPAPGRKPLSAGRYALYEAPGGGAVLAYRPDGSDHDLHEQIPAPVWQLLRRAAAGETISPAAVMRTVLGGRGG